MESGEEEIDAAFRRTSKKYSSCGCKHPASEFAADKLQLQLCADDLHKTNAARKDAELQGLRRVVAAKEKSIDSLRAQLATSKASLEAYTQEAEAIMQQKDNEVGLHLPSS